MMVAPNQRNCLAFGDLLEGFAVLGAEARLSVAGLGLDSRRIHSGEIFIARAGSRCHGLAHAGEAVTRGAAAIVYDPAAGGAELARDYEKRLPCVEVADLSVKLGIIADRFYGHPSQRLDVIGITGTNGKTSCSHFVAQALGESKPCAVMGTLGWGLPGQLAGTGNTTPDPITLHGAMARLADKGVKALAMEVSSHGLHQGRVNGVRFKGAVYTNISRDHLDYHGDMAAYQAAKLGLLRAEGLRFVVANADDASFDAVRAGLPSGVRLLPYSAAGRESADGAGLFASQVCQDVSGLTFKASWRGAVASVRAPLFGRFNVDNLLATLGVLLELGYTLDEAAGRLASVRSVPGRMERFASPGDGFTVIVDYAHTPHALESVLQSLRGHCTGRLWCVFGCGGDRDKGKRPEMGRTAALLADQVVITDDNPRGEDGSAIAAEILAGCGETNNVLLERDRRAAIAWAIAGAGRGDVVLVAGKGHENTQEIAGEHQPFSDRAVVRELLAGVAP